MLVKLVDRSSNTPKSLDPTTHNKIWMYDNIERVTVSGPHLFNPSEEKFDESVRLVCGLDSESCPVGYYRIGCLTKDGDEYALVSGHEAYIMNDSGKTIEILRT